MTTAVYCPECEAACSESDPICPLCGHELQEIHHKPTAAELRAAGAQLREAEAVQRAADALAKTDARDEQVKQEAAALAARRAAPGLGCTRCGSCAISQRRVHTGTGTALMLLGLPCICLWGFGIIMIIIGFCLTEQRARCTDCGWRFRP